MADLLEFTTAPKPEDPNAPPVFEFTLDGIALVAKRPKDAVIAQLGSIGSRRTPAVRKLELTLNFLEDCLLEPGRSILRERLTDPDDDLDAEDCMPIMHALGEHWKKHTASKKR